MKYLAANLTTAKIVKRAISFLIFAIYTLASTPSLSAIPPINAFAKYEMIQSETKELDLSILANLELLLEQSQIKLENYIPFQKMPSYDNGEVVSRRILKQTLKYWSENMNTNSPLRQTAQTLDGAHLATQLMADTSHKLSVKLRPLETQAVLNYQGDVSASLAYDIVENNVAFMVSWNF